MVAFICGQERDAKALTESGDTENKELLGYSEALGWSLREMKHSSKILQLVLRIW